MEDPDLTLHGAKAIAQEGERDIVALIPDDLIISVDQRPTGSLLSCTGERNYQWAGGTTVTVIPDTDLDAIVNDIEAHLVDGVTWTSTRTRDVDGSPELNLSSRSAGGYLVAGWIGRDLVQIYSFSPCFHLPDGMSSRGGF